jgi:hypothetical protein
MKDLKPYYIYGKVCTHASKPSIHIVPVAWENAPKGYFPIAIVKSHTILDALYTYCNEHAIILDSKSIEFQHIPFNKANFLKEINK